MINGNYKLSKVTGFERSGDFEPSRDLNPKKRGNEYSNMRGR